jgi:hypothetical protein
MTSDAAVVHAIRTTFEKFDELESARQVFLWWRREGLKYPVRRLELRSHPVLWLEPSYGMVLRTLHNPIYAGVYVFGKSETVRELGGEDTQPLPRHPGERRPPERDLGSPGAAVTIEAFGPQLTAPPAAPPRRGRQDVAQHSFQRQSHPTSVRAGCGEGRQPRRRLSTGA